MSFLHFFLELERFLWPWVNRAWLNFGLFDNISQNMLLMPQQHSSTLYDVCSELCFYHLLKKRIDIFTHFIGCLSTALILSLDAQKF